jgi:hypothetical protein
MTEIRRLIKGEQKILKFTLTDKDTKLPVVLTNCELEFKAEMEKDGIKSIIKTNTDFDKTQEVLGIVKITLTSTDLDSVGKFNCQLKITFPNSEIDKSEEFNIYVDESLI